MQNDEREIDLKLLFANIFKQWRIMIVATLVCGLLGAVFGYAKAQSANKTAAQKYQQDLATYETNKANVEAQTKTMSDAVTSLTEYSKQSIKANIDPYNEIRSVVDLSISGAADATDTHLAQITEACASYISNGIDYTSVSQTLKTKRQLIKEVVSVSSNYDSDTITVAVIGSGIEQTTSIMNQIISAVNNGFGDVKAQLGEFTVTAGSVYTNTVTDSSLLASSATASTQNALMADILARISTQQAGITAAKATVAAAPAAPASSVKSTLVKYFFLGLFGGLFLIIIFFALVFVSQGKVLSEDDLKTIYGMKILSVLPMAVSQKKTNKFDRFIQHQIDSAFNDSEKMAVEKANANITELAKDKKAIILVGSDLKKNADFLVSELHSMNPNVNYFATENVNQSPEELEKLKQADGVIVVAERNATKIDHLSKSIETINNWKKEIIGGIVL